MTALRASKRTFNLDLIDAESGHSTGTLAAAMGD